MIRVLIYYFLFTALGMASFYDCLFRKIPNPFIVWTLVNGIFLNFFNGNFKSGTMAVMAFLLAFPFYVIGAAGAGDVKIFAAAGMFFSPAVMVKIGLYTLALTAGYGLVVKGISGKKGFTRVPMAPGMMVSVILMCMGGS